MNFKKDCSACNAANSLTHLVEVTAVKKHTFIESSESEHTAKGLKGLLILWNKTKDKGDCGTMGSLEVQRLAWPLRNHLSNNVKK